ncbi:MAG: efflux RND transporter periplasmic adaptor subunit, partial [Eubacteriales bacterium]|nr:efflux RND transporter periplasmic adaptor subunit [Eubacteriales bacterium]
MKKKNKWFSTLLLVLVITALSALPVYLSRSRKDVEKEASIRTAKAERQEIASTLSGTGTLISQDDLDVELPSGVEITEYLVSNGDIVKKGQELAKVDPVSVQEAISACQETIDYLEEQMFALEYHQSTRYIMVPDTGTVKAIYCKPGDKVADVMLEYGCLGVIEINGEEWKAQAFNGTVKFINATEGATVYHNNTFIWLDDIEETSEYDTLLEEHKKYVKIMEQLASMYENEAIFSPGDGIIDGITEDDEKTDRDAENKEILGKLSELEEQEKNTERPRPNFPAQSENGEFPEMPEGFSPDSMPQMPEGFSSDSMPQMPEGFSFGSGENEKTDQQPVPAESAAAVSDGMKIIRVTSAVYEGEKNTVISAKPVANGDYVEGEVRNGMVTIGGNTYFTDNDIVDMGSFAPQDGKKYLFIESSSDPDDPDEEGPKDLKYTAVYEMQDSGSGQDPQKKPGQNGDWGDMPDMGGKGSFMGGGMGG